MTFEPVSRAVARKGSANDYLGEMGTCPGCECEVRPVEQTANGPRYLTYLVANAYREGRWDRCEMWHPACYYGAGQPYGEPLVGVPRSVPGVPV